MRHAEDVLLEVKILDNGAVLGRRKDGRPMTPADHKTARRMADSTPGITVNEVLRVFPGARVITRN